jgi:hypothetical protein
MIYDLIYDTYAAFRFIYKHGVYLSILEKKMKTKPDQRMVRSKYFSPAKSSVAVGII